MANAMTTAISSWWEQAACQSADPDFFFPLSGSGAGHSEIASAKAICASCSIQPRCLEYALDTRQEYGVWGGASEDERRVIAVRRARAELRRVS